MSTTAELPRTRPLAALAALAADVKLAHTVFALPFAFLGAMLAATRSGAPDWSRIGMVLGLELVAMFFARTFAMLANRLVDRKLDARNPRTAGRALPSGRASFRAAVTTALVSAALFLVTCGAFGVLADNWWPAILGVPVLLWIGSYGLFKRFTAWCHVFLGSSLAISPIAAALAVEPTALTDASLWLLAGAVLAWVAGFDIIYALQDVDVDLRDGLHSIPARLGPRRARGLSLGLHVGAVALLTSMLVTDARLGAIFAVAVVMTAVLLAIEHATVHRWGTTRMALTFFTLNGVVSCVLGAAGIADTLIGS